MQKLLFAIKHKLVVQFSHKPQTTKMKKTSTVLDGSEKSMIPIIKFNAGIFSSNLSKRTITLEEFSAGTGISDLTIFTVDDRILSERKKSENAPLTSKNQVQVLLALLSGNAPTLLDIASQVSLSKQTVAHILSKLVENNLAVVQDGVYSALYPLQTSTNENIIAIEAKVRDWKSGIRQAMRYKEYADYSYVAIYEKNIGPSLANISVFKQLGIGLVGVSDEGINVHLEAELSNVKTPENRLLAFERFISAIDERYETFVAGNGFVTNNAA